MTGNTNSKPAQADTSVRDLPVLTTVKALRAQVEAWRAAGERIALVPTMGALHEGHLSLTDLAGSKADRVIVSIFVNPRQFAEGEDLDAYPRGLEADLARLQGRPVDAVYAPAASEMYAPGFATTVTVSGAGEGLETDIRPHFFAGVATVVSKLLLQCLPDVAVFGEKDYQQYRVVERLVRDLDLPVEIVPGPTVREEDGLAMSSRNAYLAPDQREIAGALNRILSATAERLGTGAAMDEALREGRNALSEAGFDAVQYFEVRDSDTLEALPGEASAPLMGPARLLVAVRLGDLRLIDNLPVSPLPHPQRG